MKIFYLIFFALVVSGCIANKIKSKKITSECRTYNYMSTAPIAPSAIEDLRLGCLKSRK